MPSTARVFRIVLISPGDTEKERGIVAERIQRINSSQVRWTNELCWLDRWEDSPPGASKTSAQGLLDEFLQIDTADLVIAVFRDKIGGSVEGSSGTVHELTQARQAFLLRGSPDILVYFHRPEDPVDRAPELDSLKHEIQEWALTKYYRSPESFEDQIEIDLRSWLMKFRSSRPQLSAQTNLNDHMPVTAAVHSANSSFRLQGLTELIHALTIVLRGEAKVEGRLADISITFNTNLTSRIVAEPTTSEARLLDPKTGASYQGRQTAANSIVFERVGLTGEATQTLLCERLRINANQLGDRGLIQCSVSMLPSRGQRFPTVMAHPSIAIGLTMVKHKFKFSRLRRTDSKYPPLLSYALECVVSELSQQAWYSKEEELAAHGTILFFQFAQGEQRLEVEAEPEATRSDGLILARQISTDWNGAPTASPAYTHGCLAFEFVGEPRDLRGPQSIVFRFQLHSAVPPESGSIIAGMHLGPLSAVGTAATSAPIPRFVPAPMVSLTVEL